MLCDISDTPIKVLLARGNHLRFVVSLYRVPRFHTFPFLLRPGRTLLASRGRTVNACLREPADYLRPERVLQSVATKVSGEMPPPIEIMWWQKSKLEHQRDLAYRPDRTGKGRWPNRRCDSFVLGSRTKSPEIEVAGIALKRQ